MSALASILIGAALRVGASTVKSILEKQVGGVAGEIGGTVIDAIAKQAGVTVDELPTVPQSTLDEAVRQVEPIAPALILAEVEQQKEANRLMLAEMNKDTSFGWLWRPAGMWLMLVCIAWFVMVRPMLNALLWATGTGIQIEVGLDLATFLGIFTIYTGLYMGGNTVIRAVKKEG
ncbi:3TM-type holin [Agrobacterium pusense]|uniref:3TM-type holin n=1 Tax=Agrobacterium pusense TaxID=648995 RepID=UPI002415497A|nr:3TM-type holin [Agrobacterium pusense]WFN87255.1 3TM-type holin [Agrobacterium pusense]